MKIRTVEPMLCDGGFRPWIFVKITTDEGITGYRDCTDWDRAPSIAACVSDLGEMVIGRDPHEIEDIYWFLYRACQRAIGGIAHKAIAGINSALWDIKGKVLNTPVYQLLGGKMRDRLRLYWTHCGSARARHAEKLGLPPIKTLDDLRRVAELVVEEGFTALKTNLFPMDDLPDKPSSGGGDIDAPTLRNAVAIVETFRKTVGEDVGIALDVAFQYRLGAAIALARALEPYNMMWLETETLDAEALRTIRMSTKTPICTGESIYATHGYKPFLELHAQDVIMPDIAWNGVSMGKKIADMAEAYDVMFAPHNCHSPLTTLISAHICATVHNFMVMEFDRDDAPWRDDILTEPLKIENGHLVLSDGPGFGADLDEAEIAKHPTTGRRAW
jgi:L-alanine-DL-glutamate epimerase-like enolase superfamily enzyme